MTDVVRRLFSIACVLLAVGGVFASAPGFSWRAAAPQTPPAAGAEEEPEAERQVIDLKADLSGPVAPGDSAIFLVGNFAAQHNGAVITCDSAVRYSADRIEFFGNVLINQNTTYVYGDRAEYDGSCGEARVYSDLVKVVDGEATLYTYNFVFDTEANVGTFTGGGVMYSGDNRLEALRGYYYSDTKRLVCVDSVEMRNDEYSLRSDSVIYELDADRARFFERTHIWNRAGDYLYADRGSYTKADSLYSLTRNGYILTDAQEIWSDSLDYWRGEEHVVLRHDIQIDDSDYKVLAFGDYGEYWRDPGNALLTCRPSVVNYDPSQPDTLYARADSIWLHTIYPLREAAFRDHAASAGDGTVPDSAALTGTESSGEAVPESPESAASAAVDGAAASAGAAPGISGASLSSGSPAAPDSLAADSLGSGMHGAADSLMRDSLATDSPAVAGDTLTRSEMRARLRAEAARRRAAERAVADSLRAAERAVADSLRAIELDSIAAERQRRATAMLLEMEAREEARLTAWRERAVARLRQRQQRALKRGRELPDSSHLVRIDSLLDESFSVQDSLLGVLSDSLGADFQADSAVLRPVVDSTDTLTAADTMYRFVRAYRNVRIFRSDFQAVCDSLTADSRDSTIHLYIDPVLWNGQNQITSRIMDIYTARQQIVRAEFIEEPMMVSELDTAHYNQVAGKEMVAYFRNNSIFRNDVNGNAQTIYYMQEEGSPDIIGMLVVESGSIRFYITEENRIRQITYLTDPTYVIYPMDKIPPEQHFFLPNFKWEAARRPALGDVFDRTIRPSERHEREQLPRPRFPIAGRIDRDRRRFAEERGWVDRADVLTPDAVEWMRSLGYTPGEPRERP